MRILPAGVTASLQRWPPDAGPRARCGADLREVWSRHV